MSSPHPFHGTGAPDDPADLDDWLDQNFPDPATGTPDVGSGTPDVASGTSKPD